ncbi:MAG: hypothetical protein EXS63_08670 [Candidatus Omnitrophica bacterium]|nr:hypothetical protein [Candidatus Omnitrophota bacterium]
MNTPDASNGPPKSSWYYHPILVIFLLFFVLGPFGLPLLYKSPRFNRTWKIIWTVIMIAYTWAMIDGTIALVKLALSSLGGIQSLTGSS